MTATHPKYIPGQHCGKTQPWAYDKGICIQPIGHVTRCRFVWSEGVEINSNPRERR